MQGRNRGIGNGYNRSNSMGTGGISPGSRISPEGSMRGRGFYNSEYRNYNRGGFGRGQRRNFQPQQSPARKGDVFVEAGRLAVEYLVSKGILPPNALSGKWQNNGLKNQVGESVALSRFGNASDQGPGRKKFDDYKRRTESLKIYGNESSKELERSGSFKMDGEGTSSSSKNDVQVGKDGDSVKQSPPASEATPKSDPIEVKSETDDSILSNVDVKPAIESCDVKISDVEGGEIRDERNNNDEQQDDKEGKSLEDNQEIKPESELLRLSRFANFPTKTRSSLTKSVKIEQENVTEVKDSIMSEVPNDSSVHAMNIGSDLKEESAANEERGLASFNGQESNTTFSEKLIKQEIEGNDTVPEFQMSGRGEKRSLEDNDSWDGIKKPRERSSSVGFLPDGRVDISNSTGKRHSSEEPVVSSHVERADVSLLPKGDVACIEFTEEKQLFPGSFKTCDLNLMEVSELNENHNNASSSIGPPPGFNRKKQEMPVNIDLSMSNKTISSERFAKCGSNGKEIEVIDLESDSVHEDKRSDPVFTGLDNFQSNSHNNNEVPDAQDGYGLMISELLGNDLPNCSAVQPDINSLHNDMDLHNGEGILGDDDSIYMPFGEIPISFLRAWEQNPSQDYGKPF